MIAAAVARFFARYCIEAVSNARARHLEDARGHCLQSYTPGTQRALAVSAARCVNIVRAARACSLCSALHERRARSARLQSLQRAARACSLCNALRERRIISSRVNVRAHASVYAYVYTRACARSSVYVYALETYTREV